MKTQTVDHITHYHYDSLQEQLNFIQDANYEWDSDRNKSKYDREAEDDREDFRGGTLEECRNMKHFKDPQMLTDVRNKVRNRVADIQMTDVRRRMRFNDRKHVFVAERYHAGHKKSFATRGNKRANVPSITIGIQQGFNCNVGAEEALYSSVAGAVLAEILQDAGYNVRILSVFSNDVNGSYGQLCSIELKSFENYLDVDTCAMSTSDPRFFRYTGFLSIIKHSDLDGRDIPSGLGSTTSKSKCKEWSDRAGLDIDMMFGGDRSFDNVVNSLREALNVIEQRAKQVA